jgi:hypothetical protein
MPQSIIKPELGKNAAGEDVYMFTPEQLQEFISRLISQALPEQGAPPEAAPAQGNPLEMMKGMGGK